MAPSYSPDYATVDKLKTVPLRPVAVGEFQPRSPEAAVNKVTLRGAALAPASGTFAEYLENALRADLTELKLLDTKSDTRIDATVQSSAFSDNIPRTGQTQASGGRQVSAPSFYISAPIHGQWTIGASVTSPLNAAW